MIRSSELPCPLSQVNVVANLRTPRPLESSRPGGRIYLYSLADRLNGWEARILRASRLGVGLGPGQPKVRRRDLLLTPA